ncbi:hypothetical protein QWY84_17820 [Aquisalimonas lutea]|uniref:hypothetical protein n=1 Tax=Aquisalimonas lutea TaxID=1327750 RepID=UPI0025B5059B|nr:hypothetical protein [Aquisalimonas lutea]MDN3519468.1 hypothetical protein [Aquisalimonas lutea]
MFFIDTLYPNLHRNNQSRGFGIRETGKPDDHRDRTSGEADIPARRFVTASGVLHGDKTFPWALYGSI